MLEVLDLGGRQVESDPVDRDDRDLVGWREALGAEQMGTESDAREDVFLYVGDYLGDLANFFTVG